MPDLDFRDGKRSVPEHVATLMATLPTYKMTYDEAMKAMNLRLQSSYVDNIANKLIAASLRGER